MPVNSHTPNTLQHADSVQQTYAPQYLDGFPAAAPGDTVVAEGLNTLPVMEVPAEGKALPFARSPLHDTP